MEVLSSQNGITFSALLNVCLSALLDWGHIVQHLTGLSPRWWAELKSFWQLHTSKGILTQGEFSAGWPNNCIGTVPGKVLRAFWFKNPLKERRSLD